MAQFNPGPELTAMAGAIVNPNRFVKISAPETIIQGAAAADIIVGVAPDGAASGLACRYTIQGSVKVLVGVGGVTAGVRVTSDATGQAVAWATTNQAPGMALETRAAGEIAEILLNVPSNATVV